MRHIDIGAHKVCQITTISYSNQIVFRQRNDCKIQQFQLSKINKAKQHVLQKYCIYTMSPVPHQKLKSLMV